MAGGGGPPIPESGGKKAVDFQLNLIPCIDLLSVLISFLLMTAVWTQVARIDVQQKPTETGPEAPNEPPEEQLALTVTIKQSGYSVTKKGSTVKEIPVKGDVYDRDALGSLLAGVIADHPENHEVTLIAEDHVPYRELISVMDVCLAHELSAISVAGLDG